MKISNIIAGFPRGQWMNVPTVFYTLLQSITIANLVSRGTVDESDQLLIFSTSDITVPALMNVAIMKCCCCFVTNGYLDNDSISISSYQCYKSNCWYTTVERLSYLRNRIPYSGEIPDIFIFNHDDESENHPIQWGSALVFSLICAWTNSWTNNRDAGDLRRHRSH